MFSPVRRLMRCSADGSRPIPRFVGSTTVRPPYSTKCAELLDRDLDVEESTIVAIEKRVHPEVADHRDVERPFGEADVGGAARTLPPARRVEHDMLVHEGHAHRLDRESGRAPCAPFRSERRSSVWPSLALSLAQVRPPSRPEQAKIQPDRNKDDDALDDGRQKRREVAENKTVADDRDGQGAEHRADHCASAAEQTRAAEHDRRDDVELEAAAGVRRTAAQTRGDDDSRHRRGETADRIDREGDPLGVHARTAHRFGVGADASDISAERCFVENDVAGDEDDDSDDGGHGRAENPAAADLVEWALRIDGNRIALGQEERRAAD